MSNIFNTRSKHDIIEHQGKYGHIVPNSTIFSQNKRYLNLGIHTSFFKLINVSAWWSQGKELFKWVKLIQSPMNMSMTL